MRHIRVRGLFTIATASILFVLPAVASMAQGIDITVMTQNLYLGADTNPILNATNLPDLQAAIIGARNSVVANNFPLRAGAIASEVAARGPLLIGLQESEIVSESGASLNYADTLVAALKAQGLNYTYTIPGVGAAVHTGLTLDSTVAGIPGFTVTDQEVVLVRTDVPNFTVKSILAPTFANDVTVVSPLLGQFTLKRGYVLVEASLDGVPFQFVSTHLAETHNFLEPAEIGEILTALGTTEERQIVVGDFNARPDELCGESLPCGPAKMLTAGFTDTGAGLGPTCCQSPTLDNTVSSLNNRYDYIFERRFHAISSAALVGDQPFEEERPRWPSDHAGVTATATIVEVAGTPGFSNCFGVSISTLSQQFGNSLDAAAKALGFSDVRALRNAVRAFCRL
jgi:endonuclease/exonuclease/phosphatase family metal-dependent hydrolase